MIYLDNDIYIFHDTHTNTYTYPRKTRQATAIHVFHLNVSPASSLEKWHVEVGSPCFFLRLHAAVTGVVWGHHFVLGNFLGKSPFAYFRGLEFGEISRNISSWNLILSIRNAYFNMFQFDESNLYLGNIVGNHQYLTSIHRKTISGKPRFEWKKQHVGKISWGSWW